MEYLEMRGSVKLKADADQTVIRTVLGKLRETGFVDGGYVDIRVKQQRLSIRAEGTISESYTIRTLLLSLQDQLTETSMIGVSSVRWETLVVLKHWPSSSALQLQPYEQLAFAQ